MRKATHKQFVQIHLEMMFATIKHSSQEEREVCYVFNLILDFVL